MSVTTNTIQTFDRKGLRENLTNDIYRIAPTETPFMSNAGRAKATAVLHEWQTQALVAASTANAKVQGDNWLSFDSRPATVRVGNYTQISGKNCIVSGTVQAVDEAGRADEMDYQQALMSLELKRDIEYTCLAGPGGSAGDSSNAATAASMLAWVKTNVDKDAGGTNPTWTSGVPSAVRTDGTQRAFTETNLKTVCQLGYAAGAKFNTLMVGPFNKAAVSAFSGVATKTFYQSAVGATKIIGAADVYVSNFSTLAIVPNLFQRDRDAWLADMSKVQIAYLRPFFTKPLPEGDFEAKALITEWTLRPDNELAFGLVADLATS